MLNHYVFINYRAETPAGHIDAFCEKMLALRECIGEIQFLEIGLDEFHEERSWDLLLMMRFQSAEALTRYQQRAEHLAVMQFNAPYVSDVGAIDFHQER